MSNEDNVSVTINIPKTRTYSDKLLVSSINKKKHRVTARHRQEMSAEDVKRFSIPDEASLPLRKLRQTETLLPFKHYYKQHDRSRFKRRLTISIYDKYKIISTDLQKRLHVEHPLNDVRSVLDVDKDYYKLIVSQSLHLHYPVYKSLTDSVNKILRIKHETAMKKDCVLNIETDHSNELDVHALSAKRLTEQIKHFDAFISEDYKKSMAFLSRWDKLKLQLDSKMRELQSLGIEKFTVKSRLISLEYKYSVQLKYGRFLYYLSPPTWRLNNRNFARSVEIEAKGFDYGNSQDEDTFAIIFEKLRKICYGTSTKPVLYFVQPKDIMNVFNAMETQQLHYYTHVNHLTPHTKVHRKEIKLLKEVISQEYAVVDNVIKVYENLLKFSEDQCAELEFQFYKILYGLFYNSVGLPDVLKLNLHLQFCYEKVFLEKPMNIEITAMAKSIELLYMDYSKRLDGIKSNNVRRAMFKCVEIEKLKAKKAQHAARELRSFHRLERALLSAFGIDADNLYIPIKNSTDKDKIDTHKNKIIRRHSSKRKQFAEGQGRKSLTEYEREYLLLFTDWTENEDPANYLQSLTFRERKDEN